MQEVEGILRNVSCTLRGKLGNRRAYKERKLKGKISREFIKLKFLLKIERKLQNLFFHFPTPCSHASAKV